MTMHDYDYVWLCMNMYVYMHEIAFVLAWYAENLKNFDL